MRWLAHVLGIDTQQSYFYDWWSGVATQLPSLVIGVAWLRRHNCHARRCARLGKHQVEGTSWCSKHRP